MSDKSVSETPASDTLRLWPEWQQRILGDCLPEHFAETRFRKAKTWIIWLELARAQKREWLTILQAKQDEILLEWSGVDD
jgi:hypothetical protein